MSPGRTRTGKERRSRSIETGDEIGSLRSSSPTRPIKEDTTSTSGTPVLYGFPNFCPPFTSLMNPYEPHVPETYFTLQTLE